jgi:glutaryl-CoA dehydrogenase
MSPNPLDYLDLDHDLSDEERAVRDSVRRFVDSEVRPIIADHWRDGRPLDLYPKLAELGLLGANLEGYGCANMGPVAYGLAMRELERGDSCVRSMVGVQSNLAMFPIWRFGSDAQKERWLPKMVTAEITGCFGLSEPDAGSDPGNMRTTARRGDGGWILNGTKRWITNGTNADLCVIWARAGDSARSIKGFVVDGDAEGLTREKIENKQSFRASDTAELILEDVFVPDDQVLEGAEGLGAPLTVLTQARFGIIWGVLGSAEACLEEALSFAKERIAFGKPIAGFQLVQRKLVEMATEIAKARLLAVQLARLKERGGMTGPHISMGKMNNVEVALRCARLARDVLGANGIMDDYPVIRHLCNLETVFTYEGTHDVHLLVVGHALTGENAFT